MEYVSLEWKIIGNLLVIIFNLVGTIFIHIWKLRKMGWPSADALRLPTRPCRRDG
jgi:hypothetical protein